MRAQRFLLVSLLAALPACSTPPMSSACPSCDPGTHCDSVSATCVADSADAATGGDMPAPGSCNPACGGATSHCNPTHHCVACLSDNQCGPGQVCHKLSDAVWACQPGCADDARCQGAGKSMACCGMKCVDTATDAANCGGCGKACKGMGAQPTCVGGTCRAGACGAGYGDCNMDPKDGCEANLRIDPLNCTACGSKCAIAHAVNACANGCYMAACLFGYDDCNGDPMDGCETSTLADAANCGSCGNSCADPPNATATCVNGTCLLGSCKMGYSDCDGDPKNGCEANLQLDAKNCARCGNACPMNAPACANGACGTLFVFQGVKNNLPVNSLGGWSQCYLDTYANSGTSIKGSILAKCTGSYLLLGCRPVGAPMLQVAAMAPRADVIFDTAMGNNAHMANGVGWYFSDSWSWGFAQAGDPISRNSCDTDAQNPEQRLCWHSGGGNINSGYRCGSRTLNGDMTFERVIYQSM